MTSTLLTRDDLDLRRLLAPTWVLVSALALGGCVVPPSDESDQVGGTEDADPFGQATEGSGDTGDTDGTEGEQDAACVDTHSEADATVEVDWMGWPQLPEGTHGYEVAVEFDVACAVTSVDPAADPVVTVLECDDAGTERPLSFTIPGRETPVAWAVGDAVQVAYHHLAWDYVHYGLQRDELSMRRADDGALLLASMNQDWLYADTFAPVVLTIDEERCRPEGSNFENDTWNVVVGFDNGAGVTTDVGHMQRGTLPPAVGEGVLAIDVDEARFGEYYCCHAGGHVRALLRRVDAP